MIPEQFIATREYYEKFKNVMQLLPPDYYDDIDFYNLDDALTDEWTELLNNSFSTEYQILTGRATYFEGCQHSVYLKTYNERLNKYIELHPDANESYFIKSEYKVTINIKPFTYGTQEQLVNFHIAIDRRKGFLAEKAIANGFTVGDPNVNPDSDKTTVNIEHYSTVFGDFNYQLLYDMYDATKAILSPTVTKKAFANTFLLNDKPNDKIDFIGANISTFAYLIMQLHPHFTTDFRKKGIYNQWWADRFTFSGSPRDKKGISTMCSAVNKKEKSPDKRKIIDEVLILFQ